MAGVGRQESGPTCNSSGSFLSSCDFPTLLIFITPEVLLNLDRWFEVTMANLFQTPNHLP